MWASEAGELTVLAGERTVCAECAVASNPLRRMKGLLGRRSLADQEGLLLRPAPSVHTAFMRFPIDVVFLDRKLRIVKLRPEVPPWRAAAAKGARMALELAAGRAAALGLREGDQLRLVPQVPSGDAT